LLCLGTNEILPSSKEETISNTIFSVLYLSDFDLQVASAWTESFDTLLDAYKQLAESIPLLEQYQALFRNNQHMVDALSEIYADILEFHGAALRVFKQPSEVPKHGQIAFVNFCQHGVNCSARHGRTSKPASNIS
jgi:hypothetical protein